MSPPPQQPQEQTINASSPNAVPTEDQAVCMPEPSQISQPDASITGTEETAEKLIETLLAEAGGNNAESQDLACPEATSTLDLDNANPYPDSDALFSLYFPEPWASPPINMANDGLMRLPGQTPKTSWEGLDGFSINAEYSSLPREHAMSTEDATIFDTGFYGLSNDALGYPATSWTSIPMPLHNALLDPSTRQKLTLHYFETVCQILSCFDSHENPFRSDIPTVMLTCDYVHDCIIGMSAAHLANSSSGMESIALNHQARAMAGLSLVIQTIRPSGRACDDQITRQDHFGRSARYQALLAAMLLGISSVSLLHSFLNT